MSTSLLSLIALFLYLAILVPICIKARNSQYAKNASSHYLANRSLGFMVLLLTLYATTFSGNTLLGQTGQAYRVGYIWVMLVGLWMASIMSFHFVVPKLRPLAIKHHFITPGDWIRYRFDHQATGKLLRLLVTICLCIALVNFLFSQLKAAGEILEVMTEGALPYNEGIVIFALVILVYDAMGGLRAVAWTDVIQGLIMVAGITCLLIWLLNNTGGLAHLTEQISQLRPGNDQIPPPTMQIKWFSLIFLGGLSVTVYPQTMQRIFAAQSSRTLHQSLASMGVVIFLTSSIVLFTGWAAIPLFDLDTGPVADQVLPRLLGLWASSSVWHGGAALLVMLAVLAAIMSTADSVLLSLVSMLRHDLMDQSDRQNLKYDGYIALLIMLPICLLALNRDISLWRLIEVKLELLLQCFPAFVLALHWLSVRASAVLSGLIVGLVILLTSLCLSIKQLYGINIGLLALTANILVVYLVNLCLLRPAKNMAD